MFFCKMKDKSTVFPQFIKNLVSGFCMISKKACMVRCCSFQRTPPQFSRFLISFLEHEELKLWRKPAKSEKAYLTSTNYATYMAL